MTAADARLAPGFPSHALLSPMSIRSIAVATAPNRNPRKAQAYQVAVCQSINPVTSRIKSAAPLFDCANTIRPSARG